MHLKKAQNELKKHRLNVKEVVQVSIFPKLWSVLKDRRHFSFKVEVLHNATGFDRHREDVKDQRCEISVPLLINQKELGLDCSPHEQRAICQNATSAGDHY
jgi:hypothetical protein